MENDKVAELEAAWAVCPHPRLADKLLELDPQDYLLAAPRLSAATVWAEQIAERDDPRASAAQAAVLATLPYTSDGSKDFWRAFFAGLSDPRFLAVSEEALAVRPRFKPWLVKRLREAQARITGEVAPLPASFESLVAAEVDEEEHLLAAVYASPEDDGPRRVYADWLTGRGDPRGLFITHQLDGNLRAAKKLLKGNELAWTPLGPALLKKGLVYERGFPARVHTGFKKPVLVESHGAHPAWATVVEVRAPQTWDADKVAYMEHLGPAFRGLRVFKGGSVGVLENLAALVPPLEIEELHLRANHWRTCDCLATFDALPALHTLYITGPQGTQVGGMFWRHPLVRQVRHLGFHRQRLDLLPGARTGDFETVTFDLSSEGAKLVFSGEGLDTLEIHGSSTSMSLNLADLVARAEVRTLRLVPGKKWTPEAGLAERLQDGVVAPTQPVRRDLPQVITGGPEGCFAVLVGTEARIYDGSLQPVTVLYDHAPFLYGAWGLQGELLLVSRFGAWTTTLWDVEAGTRGERTLLPQHCGGAGCLPDGQLYTKGPVHFHGDEEPFVDASSLFQREDGTLGTLTHAGLRIVGQPPVPVGKKWSLVQTSSHLFVAGPEGDGIVEVAAYQTSSLERTDVWKVRANQVRELLGMPDGTVLARCEGCCWRFKLGEEPVSVPLDLDRAGADVLAQDTLVVARWVDDDVQIERVCV